MTITEFLLARIAEDERRANGRWRVKDMLNHTAEHDMDFTFVKVTQGGKTVRLTEEQYRDQFMDHNPDRRLLAECAAKRAIVADRLSSDRSAADDEWSWGWSDANYRAVKAIAAVYADHPDYQQEWAL